MLPWEIRSSAREENYVKSTVWGLFSYIFIYCLCVGVHYVQTHKTSSLFPVTLPDAITKDRRAAPSLSTDIFHYKVKCCFPRLVMLMILVVMFSKQTYSSLSESGRHDTSPTG